MKNHINGEKGVVQTNKKWTHLKQKQKEWISNLLKERYVRLAKEKGTPPSKVDCAGILAEVLCLIEARDMWIPEGEVKRHFDGKKVKWQKQVEKNYQTTLKRLQKNQ